LYYIPIGAYIGELPEIDYIMPFGYKYYAWINRKSFLKTGRTNKLIYSGQVSVFIKYLNEITKQYKVYIPDLGYTIKSSVVDFDKDVLEGTVNFKLRGIYL